MKWKKCGRAFDPTDHVLPNGCKEFAQSPQALVYDDRVRVYFSTRVRDAGGKYLSHVAFADFDHGMQTIRGVSTKPVIALGELGCFDEHGIFPMNVIRHDGTVYAYTCGWSRRTSVPVETSIGRAVSRDEGLTFTKTGLGPIVTSSMHEPFLVGDPFVAVLDGTWYMWYIYGTAWLTGLPLEDGPARVYKIGQATSYDGIRWIKTGRQLIGDRLGDLECQALPTVIRIGQRFHMLFCYRQAYDFRLNRSRSYRLGYAYSDDLRTWTRDDDRAGMTPPEEGWDSQMQCYPHLFRCGDRVYLLYNGNEFGRWGFGLAILEEA